MYLSAKAGARRGEICAVLRSRIGWEAETLLISRTIVKLAGAGTGQGAGAKPSDPPGP